MKVKSFGIGVMIAVLFIATSTMAAASAGFPPIPSDYSGYVTVNGDPAPDGATIYAMIGDYSTSSIQISDGGYVYLIIMPSDSDYVGETIEFYYDPDAEGSLEAVKANETDTFEPGTSHDPFNLSLIILDSTAPVISGITVSDVSTSGAKITWSTNEPSTGQVEYGSTSSYGSLSALNSALTTSHSVSLTGLDEATTYHFRVVSEDEAGNPAHSTDWTLQTDSSPIPPPPYIPPPITGSNEPPVSEAGPDRTAYVNTVIHFSGKGSYDPDGTVMAYIWNFGDGITKSGLTLIYSYEEPGTYLVTLTVTDDHGSTNSDNCTVEVEALPAPLTANVEGAVPANFTGYVLDASEVADTTVTMNTTFPVTVTVLRFESNPHPDDPMPEGFLPKFVDIFISDLDGVDWPIYVEITYTDDEAEGLDESSLGIHYWSDDSWRRCSNTGVDVEANKVWAYMLREETLGSPILVGGSTQAYTPAPAEFQFSQLIIEPQEAKPSEEVIISLRVTNIGEATGNHTVSLDVGEGLFTSVKTVTLEGGESETLMFTVIPEAEGTYRVEIEGLVSGFEARIPPPLMPAEFVLSELEASPGDVSAGEAVTVTVNVANIGEVEGSHMVILEVDGEESEGLNVTLEANASTVVSFTIVEYDPGSHGVGVEALTDTFKVLKPAEFDVSGLSIDPDELEEGGEVTISVSVCNIGEEAGSHTVGLKLDGSMTDDRSLTLEGGADATVSFSVLMGVGTHTAEVESLTGSFTITAQPEQPSQQSFPWTSAVAVGAVALVVIGLIARRYMG